MEDDDVFGYDEAEVDVDKALGPRLSGIKAKLEAGQQEELVRVFKKARVASREGKGVEGVDITPLEATGSIGGKLGPEEAAALLARAKHAYGPAPSQRRGSASAARATPYSCAASADQPTPGLTPEQQVAQLASVLGGVKTALQGLVAAAPQSRV